MMHNERSTTVAALTRPGKGILAADESQPTIGKRFQALGIESTEESTPSLSDTAAHGAGGARAPGRRHPVRGDDGRSVTTPAHRCSTC